MGDIHLHYHHQTHLMAILMRVNMGNEGNGGKESTDCRFRVVSEDDQHKNSLPSDITQYVKFILTSKKQT